MKRVLLLLLIIMLTSCEPELCEDCWTVTDANGSYWTCIEYDCSTY